MASIPCPGTASLHSGRHPRRAHPAGSSPIELLKALKRHWVVALTLGLLCSGTAAVLAWKLLPNPTYTATSLVRVRTSLKSLLDSQERG